MTWIVFTLWRYEKIRQKMLSWKVEKCLEKKTSRTQIFRHYIQKLEQNSKRRLIWKNSEKGPVVWKRYGIIPSKMFDGGWGARNHARGRHNVISKSQFHFNIWSEETFFEVVPTSGCKDDLNNSWSFQAWTNMNSLSFWLKPSKLYSMLLS